MHDWTSPEARRALGLGEELDAGGVAGEALSGGLEREAGAPRDLGHEGLGEAPGGHGLVRRGQREEEGALGRSPAAGDWQSRRGAVEHRDRGGRGAARRRGARDRSRARRRRSGAPALPTRDHGSTPGRLGGRGSARVRRGSRPRSAPRPRRRRCGPPRRRGSSGETGPSCRPLFADRGRGRCRGRAAGKAR